MGISIWGLGRRPVWVIISGSYHLLAGWGSDADGAIGLGRKCGVSGAIGEFCKKIFRNVSGTTFQRKFCFIVSKISKVYVETLVKESLVQSLKNFKSVGG
jgi:hypothetical protein